MDFEKTQIEFTEFARQIIEIGNKMNLDDSKLLYLFISFSAKWAAAAYLEEKAITRELVLEQFNNQYEATLEYLTRKKNGQK